MGVIKPLPPEVFGRIAAGEVVERPASALKEILENALDAGAARVAVEAAGAGRKTLRVVDDGAGMDPDDARLCLARHATSKLSELDDLESLRTFGFRGEALYAIAAVSRLELVTCRAGAKEGWRVKAEGGVIAAESPAPAVPGTTVSVSDLFFNTPARAKFLKSDASEKSRLVAVVEEAALAHPEVALSYKSEGRTVLNFKAEKGPDARRRRLTAVLGEEIAQPLLAVSADRPEARLVLFASPPDGLVATRDLQQWFINRRPVASRVLQQALYRAYGEHRAGGKHPVCVGFLELDPASFDVNVHPGKREIRFKSDREIHELVAGLIASTLAKGRSAAPLTRAPYGILSEPRSAARGGALSGGMPQAAEFSSALSSAGEQEAFLALESTPSEGFVALDGAPRWFTPPYRYLGQIERSYLVFEASGGIFILDQHAAQERILFERYVDQLASGEARAQALMLPLAVELPASRVAAVIDHAERLKKLGFEVASLGKTTLQVTAVPALFHKADDVKELVHRLLDSLERPSRAVQDVQHEAAATVACKAAVKAHDPLTEKEALRLIDDLKSCRDGSACPHGRRTMLALSRQELARRFERPGAPPL